VNTWTTFKDKLADEHLHLTLGDSTVLLIQEHKILTAEGIHDAVEHCARHGWLATFSLAKRLESGLASGGVGILLKKGGDVGVTRIDQDFAEQSHRLLAVRVQVPGMVTHVLASVYLEAVAGLNTVNKELLASVALLQHQENLPIIAGGDFNMQPDVIVGTDFLTRASLRIVAPDRATCVTKKASRIIDYYVVSESFVHSVAECHTVQYFLRPHRPVSLTFTLQDELVPVLCKPP
jgi:hypothetical protein